MKNNNQTKFAQYIKDVPTRAKSSGKIDILEATLFIIAVSISCIAIITMAYTWSVVSDLQESSKKMERILALENGITRQLDEFNIGIQTLNRQTNERLSFLQSRINKVTSDYDSTRSELNQLTTNLEEKLDTLNEDTIALLDERIRYLIDIAISNRLAQSAKSKSNSNSNVKQPVRVQPSPARAITPKGYKRIVGANGKVTYSKTR